MKPRTPILVLDGESFLTRKVVRSLAQAGRWQIHVLGKRSAGCGPGTEWSRHVASFHWVESNLAIGDYLKAVVRVARRTRAEVLLPVEEDSVLFCIRNRGVLEEWLSLVPLPGEAEFSTAIDKRLLADFMAEAGIAHPRSARMGATDGLQFPVLLKPARSCGGRGIVDVSSPTDLAVEVGKRPHGGAYFVQERVPGMDMGCSVLARDGKIEAWTIQRGLARASAFSPFSELHFEWNPAVFAVVERLFSALRWSGVANVDLRIDARTGQPLVLEINGRFWASLLGSTAAGVNFPDLACRLACGEDMPLCEPRTGTFVEARAAHRHLMQGSFRGLQLGWRELLMIGLDPMPELACRWSRRCGYPREDVVGRIPVHTGA